MSEQMVQDDALERRLRAHYASEYGQPPAPSAIWEGISAELGSATPGHTNTDRADRAVGDTTDRPLPLQPAMRRDRRPWRLRLLPLVAAALVVAIFATLLLGPLGRSGRGLTGATSTPSPTKALPTSFVLDDTIPAPVAGASLADVQMLSRDEGWAVGDKRVSNMEIDALILHYSGGHWQEFADAFPNAQLRWVSMTSPDDGWAGGYATGHPGGVLLHYTGGRWISVPVPGDFPLTSIQMVNPDIGWAIQVQQKAAYGDSARPLRYRLLRYVAGKWSLYGSDDAGVMALSMVSSSDGWAAGQQGVILHYQGGEWQSWNQRAPGDVTALTMVSSTDGWLTGVAPTINGDGDHKAFMMHFDGRSWKAVDLPDLKPTSGFMSNAVLSISMTSSQEGWAVGTWGGGSGFLYHYTDGAWQYAGTSSSPLTSVWMVSANEGWAVSAKQIVTNGNEDAFILHIHTR